MKRLTLFCDDINFTFTVEKSSSAWFELLSEWDWIFSMNCSGISGNFHSSGLRWRKATLRTWIFSYSWMLTMTSMVKIFNSRRKIGRFCIPRRWKNPPSTVTLQKTNWTQYQRRFATFTYPIFIHLRLERAIIVWFAILPDEYRDCTSRYKLAFRSYPWLMWRFPFWN